MARIRGAFLIIALLSGELRGRSVAVSSKHSDQSVPLVLSPLPSFRTVLALALWPPHEVEGNSNCSTVSTCSPTLLRRAGTPPANHPPSFTGSSPTHSRASSQQEHAPPASPQASNSWDRLLRGAEAAEKFNPNKGSAEASSRPAGADSVGKEKRPDHAHAGSATSATQSSSWDRLLRGAEAAEQFNLHKDSAEVSSSLKEQHGVESSGTSKQPEPGPGVRYNVDGSIRLKPGPKRGSTLTIYGTPRKKRQPSGPLGPFKLDGTLRRPFGPAPGTTKGRKTWNAGLSEKDIPPELRINKDGTPRKKPGPVRGTTFRKDGKPRKNARLSQK